MRRVLLLVLAAGCGDNRGAPDVDGGADAPYPDAPASCGTVVTPSAPLPSPHVELCSQVAYTTNPPTSGPHYPTWAKYKVYDRRIGRPFWVHDLEHGAVVVAYNCPEGCADEVAALTSFLAARAPDPLCSAAVRNRFVVTPDPELDVRFAAMAWGFALESDCFDLGALGGFIDEHYAHAPEDLCNDGLDVLDPASGLPPNCP
jgi:hypothetical protein